MQINIGKRYYIVRRAGWFNVAIASGNRFKMEARDYSGFNHYHNRVSGDEFMDSPIPYPLVNRVIEKKHIDRILHIHPSKLFFEGVVIKGKAHHPDQFKVYGLSRLKRKKTPQLMVYGVNDEL